MKWKLNYTYHPYGQISLISPAPLLQFFVLLSFSSLSTSKSNHFTQNSWQCLQHSLNSFGLWFLNLRYCAVTNEVLSQTIYRPSTRHFHKVLFCCYSGAIHVNMTKFCSRVRQCVCVCVCMCVFMCRYSCLIFDPCPTGTWMTMTAKGDVRLLDWTAVKISTHLCI